MKQETVPPRTMTTSDGCQRVCRVVSGPCRVVVRMEEDPVFPLDSRLEWVDGSQSYRPPVATVSACAAALALGRGLLADGRRTVGGLEVDKREGGRGREGGGFGPWLLIA